MVTRRIRRSRLFYVSLIGAVITLIFPAVCHAQDVPAPEPAGTGKTQLRVMVRFNNPPYAFIDQDGQPAGLDVDISKAVAKELGREAVFNAGCHHEMRDALAAGAIDLVAGSYVSEARKKRLAFSDSYIEIDYGLFVRAGSDIGKLEDLTGKRIVVRHGDPMTEYVTLAGLSTRVTTVDNVKEALHLLAERSRDCALLPKRVALHTLYEEDFGRAVAARNMAVRLKYSFATAIANTDLIAEVNVALTKIATAGTIDDLHAQWLGPLDTKQNIDVKGFLPHILTAIAIAAAVLVGLSGMIRYRALKTRSDNRFTGMETELLGLKSVRRKLNAEKQSLISLLKNAPHGVVVLNRGKSRPAIGYLNEAATRITGYTLDDVKNMTELFERVFPEMEYREQLMQRWERLANNDFKDGGFSVAFRNTSGDSRRLDFQAGSLGDDNVILMFSDVTERYEMQEQQHLLDGQIRQSQKLEAMGQLAGGVAHDFNNLLTSISGNAQLLDLEMEADSDQAEMVGQILAAAKRAGELTKQLLAYARKGKYQITEVDVHDIMGEAVKLLQHSVNRLVTVELDLQAESPVIFGDASQVQGALLNLGVNARDAMPDGGTLVYSTSMVELDKDACREYMHDISPGEYLQIKVTDTGTGMDKAVVERIYEPFFTTKEQGKGTGLGLAAVYGCVKNHRGSIKVDSALGKGTSFTILFPTSGVKQGAASKNESESPPMVKGRGHIMLVDDEEDVRRLTAKALRKLGYLVTTLVDGVEATDYYREHHNNVDLVILDMVMPNMDGRSAFKEMKKVDPDVRVLVVSGFAAEETARECMHEGALDFIAKPFWIGDLSQAVGTYIQSG